MVQRDKLNDRLLDKDAKFDEIDDEIVGLQRKKRENLSTEEKAKLTTAQKIQKELTYLTQAMDLSPAEAKHWYYKLKREYEEEARILKKMQERQARKDFRKLMK